MKPEQVPPQRRNATFVLPDWKLVYISTPKAACTSIKWMLADLQGVDERRFYASLSSETTRATTIHQRRGVWGPDTPRLRDLTSEQLADITPENGWFVFTMTRHPGARLWSAWQSKFLLREPRFRAQFRTEPWLPSIPATTNEVIEDWEKFVAAIAATPKMPIMRDIHFRPQAALLNVGTAWYDRIYDTSEFSEMVRNVRAHLERIGWTGELSLRRSNETPLPPLQRAFPGHVRDTIARLYRADLAKLGYDDAAPPHLRTADYSPDLLAAAGIIAERGERIGDLSRRARRAAKRADSATTEADDCPTAEPSRGRLHRVLHRS
jgi:Sulfotransferase family